MEGWQKLCKQGGDDSNEQRLAYEDIHPYIVFTLQFYNVAR